MMEFKDELVHLRTSIGMNRKQFAQYFEIPYRTIQEWELENRKMPEYLLQLMKYKVKTEMEKGVLVIVENERVWN